MIFYGVGALAVFWGLLHISTDYSSFRPSPIQQWSRVGCQVCRDGQYVPGIVYVPYRWGIYPACTTNGHRCRSFVSWRTNRLEAFISDFHWFFLVIITIIQPSTATNITATLVLIAAVGINRTRDIATKLVRENFSNECESKVQMILLVFPLYLQ